MNSARLACIRCTSRSDCHPFVESIQASSLIPVSSNAQICKIEQEFWQIIIPLFALSLLY
jgi:hypothetical protein